MSKTSAVLPVLALAALAIPDAARAQFTRVPSILGEDAALTQLVVDRDTGTTIYLSINGYRSTQGRRGQGAQTSAGCEVDITEYDATGYILFQGSGFADPSSMTMSLNRDLTRATLEATMFFIDFRSGEELVMDVDLTFTPN